VTMIPPAEKAQAGENLGLILFGLFALGAVATLWSWHYNLQRTGSITRRATA
jgi:hypothetical protein